MSTLPDKLVLTGVIRDFHKSHPDFEMDDTQIPGGFGLDLGIVETTLQNTPEGRKPIYAGKPRTPWTTGKENFDQWYRNVPGINKAIDFSITLKRGSNNVYTYENKAFFPIDGKLFGNEMGRAYPDHNYHFTFEGHWRFTYQPGQVFKFFGDDDLWIFIDGKRVVDIGGVHKSMATSIELDKLGLTPGKAYDFDFFFAERHTSESQFRIDTSFELIAPPLANIITKTNQGTLVAPDDDSASEPGLDTGAFFITLDKPATEDLTIGYVVTGTAQPGADYQPLSGSVTIAKGQTQTKVLVNPIDDPLIEATETVIATLQPGTGYQMGSNSTATVTIADNDLPAATIVASDPSSAEPADTGEFIISFDQPALKDLSVNYLVGGTAEPGVDYQPLAGSVTLAQGQTQAKIVVSPIDDRLIEGPETVILTLQPGSGYQVGTAASATVTIWDNDAPVVTVIGTDPGAAEPADTGEFAINLDQAALTDLTISYSVSGSAQPGVDYQALSGNVTIPQGQTQVKIPVVPIDDATVEAPETVIVTLQAGAGYQLADASSATVTIWDDDAPTATIVATDPNAQESPWDPGEFTISFDQAALSDLSISYSVGGSATPGVDYQTLSSSVIIPQGQTQVKIPVNPIDDALVEAPETIVVSLQPGGGYRLGASTTATVTLGSNDVQAAVLPTVSIVATDPNATEPGQGPATDIGICFVRLDKAAAQDVNVTYFVGGSATPGGDYQPLHNRQLPNKQLAGNIVIPKGQLQARLNVVPKADLVYNETPETVVIFLQNGAGYRLDPAGQNKALVTIQVGARNKPQG
ncbi:Calx-beta domain-containing protein [Leptolyngbya sp. FACHB-261]|uniref:Calx-beta domain-containing protein n=1 Tax=Leptolyngbya sp. FACHB-261 TaxID=2692806 RepID=UPI00168509CD|nr:Calx-beta domain-containing protein [Leptolyngbya sp. FACHB-261]MBD2100137.1 fibro-slime domain-containing protein [Leptolyngbya sp. FACHB-261]